VLITQRTACLHSQRSMLSKPTTPRQDRVGQSRPGPSQAAPGKSPFRNTVRLLPKTAARSGRELPTELNADPRSSLAALSRPPSASPCGLASGFPSLRTRLRADLLFGCASRTCRLPLAGPLCNYALRRRVLLLSEPIFLDRAFCGSSAVGVSSDTQRFPALTA